MRAERNEYPRPQFERENWENLNGIWEFEIDNSRSGIFRGLQQNGKKLSGAICVPFCPESELSGVGNKDFMAGVWYKKRININNGGNRVILHFGAADYYTGIFINGTAAGEHRGGYASFEFDITEYIINGENEITVYCEDDTRDPRIPSGKQCFEYNSVACYYTRTTGIWQTVWLEYLPQEHLKSVKYYPNISNCSVTVAAELAGKANLSAQVFYEGKLCGKTEISDACGCTTFEIKLSEKHLWEPGAGRLYDLKLSFGNDEVKSYFGLREVFSKDGALYINGKPVFQRLILDQGYYPDGIYTAPSDEALKQDIMLAMNIGFDGARLHEKIFEERFLYYADKLGYIVWAEYPNWGLDHTDPKCIYSILPEWLEEIKRDFNHPSIIGWCPFNETMDLNGHKQFDKAIETVFEVTKQLDATRPCIDSSGYYHVKTDIYDLHDYEQNPEKFAAHYSDLNNMTFPMAFSERQKYKSGAIMISEYGGTAWDADGNGWGYGDGPKSEEEFLSRFAGLTNALLNNPMISGFCYTQLTDVEQEQNGLYTYGRKPKFSIEKIRETVRGISEFEKNNRGK